MKYKQYPITKYWQAFSLLLLCCLGITGCKKLIEVDLPIDRNPSETVFATTSTAVSAMTGVYVNMISEFCGPAGVSIAPALLCDEFKLKNEQGDRLYANNIDTDHSWDTWRPIYRTHMFGVNSVIEGVRKSTSLPARAKAILEGEARFTRAFLYLHLLSFYGDVPLALSTDFNVNSKLPRTAVDKVYDQIEEDLRFAQQNLDNRYLAKDLYTNAATRLRPNKGAANALLARVYLYRQKWAEAEAAASLLINDPQYELVNNLDAIFLKESHEAIWQIQTNQLEPDGVNTLEARYMLPRPGEDPRYYVSEDLYQSFEPGDQRRVHWTMDFTATKKCFYKYKQGFGVQESKEYLILMRLAEQFLIRAEARAQLGKLTGPGSAAEDLNRIRLRTGLGNTPASTKEELIDAILRERRIELSSECGHRWLDLKRTGRLQARMSIVTPLKGGVWLPYKELMPIPPGEFTYNPSLRGHQNPGYYEVP